MNRTLVEQLRKIDRAECEIVAPGTLDTEVYTSGTDIISITHEHHLIRGLAIVVGKEYAEESLLVILGNFHLDFCQRLQERLTKFEYPSHEPT